MCELRGLDAHTIQSNWHRVWVLAVRQERLERMVRLSTNTPEIWIIAPKIVPDGGRGRAAVLMQPSAGGWDGEAEGGLGASAFWTKFFKFEELAVRIGLGAACIIFRWSIHGRATAVFSDRPASRRG